MSGDGDARKPYDHVGALLNTINNRNAEIAALASEGDTLRAVLRWISVNYLNPDFDHVEYRVEACDKAREALGEK